MAYISKTDYVLWRECAKNAWLKLHRPDIYYAAELTEFEQSIIDAGLEVESAARGLFPDGTLIAASQTEAQHKTAELLTANSRTLFQPVFEKDSLLAAIDVLEFDGSTGQCSIHEIKSSTQIEDEYLYDLAFQVVLLRKTGRKITRACLIHLNPNYTRQGDLDHDRLFVSVDMTSRVDQIADSVALEMEQALAYLLAEAEPQARALVSIKQGRGIAAPFDIRTRKSPTTVSMISRASATVRKSSSNWWMPAPSHSIRCLQTSS